MEWYLLGQVNLPGNERFFERGGPRPRRRQGYLAMLTPNILNRNADMYVRILVCFENQFRKPLVCHGYFRIVTSLTDLKIGEMRERREGRNWLPGAELHSLYSISFIFREGQLLRPTLYLPYYH
jgi:hypothetical protein